MTIPNSDKEILRELGRQKAELATLPIMKEHADLYRRAHNFEPARPIIENSQQPWHELNVDDELTLKCENPFFRGFENQLRMELYKWNHMPGDMSIGGGIGSPQAVRDTGFGISEDVEIRRTDEKSSVVSRHFHIQIKDESDVDKIKDPVVTFDAEKTEENYQILSEVFDGVLPVHKSKQGGFWFAPWDELVRWTGVQEILMDMATRPDYVHKLMTRFVDAWLVKLQQYEEQDLLSAPVSELTAVGAAQIFSEVSPQMHEEFALKHEARYFSRFKKTVYGCCEPLHHKVDVIAKNIPNLHQISMSPWVDFDEAVKNVGNKFIFHWKPNPAVFTTITWNPKEIRRDMREKMGKAMAGGCTMIATMKDISTVQYKPEHLWEWTRIASEVSAEFE